jgi:hypothetical protein
MWLSISSSASDSHMGTRGSAEPPRLPSMIDADSATHSLQMYTPAPATSVPTSVLGLPQKEHRASPARVSGIVTAHSSGVRMSLTD